jgi:hypothetical protein
MPRMDKLSSYKTVYINNDEGGLVIYQKTKIVEWDNNGNVTLNSDDWMTVTTKRKMNQASNQFCLRFGVVQRNFCWYVTLDGCEEIPYYDNMTFNIYTARVAA